MKYFLFREIYLKYYKLKKKKVKLATVVDGDPKAPFSIASTLRCTGSIPYITEC